MVMEEDSNIRILHDDVERLEMLGMFKNMYLWHFEEDINLSWEYYSSEVLEIAEFVFDAEDWIEIDV